MYIGESEKKYFNAPIEKGIQHTISNSFHKFYGSTEGRSIPYSTVANLRIDHLQVDQKLDEIGSKHHQQRPPHAWAYRCSASIGR